MNLSYQKARFISDRGDEFEPEKARSNWVSQTGPRICQYAKEKNAIIWFGDEVSFAMWGSLGRTWAPRGEQPVVKTTGIRKGLKMFGAIEFNGGHFQYLESLAYSLTPKSIKALKADEVAEDILKKAYRLKK